MAAILAASSHPWAGRTARSEAIIAACRTQDNKASREDHDAENAGRRGHRGGVLRESAGGCRRLSHQADHADHRFRAGRAERRAGAHSDAQDGRGRQAAVRDREPPRRRRQHRRRGGRPRHARYPILLGTGSLLAINVSLYKNLGYDPEKDFEPITLIGTQTNVLYTHPSVPAKTLGELIDYAKANPGKLSFGSGGNGTPAHLAGELLKIEAKIDMAHVPFRGTGPALQNVIAGHVPMAFNPPPPLLPHIQSGAIRAIAVTTLKRTAALPDVPTIAERGFPGFDATTWHALVAPAGTPREITAALNRAAVAALTDPEGRKALTELGVDVVGSTPEELRDYIKSEIPKWATIVKASGAKME